MSDSQTNPSSELLESVWAEARADHERTQTDR